MLAPAGSQGSLDPATGHPILPSLRLTQRVAPGLRNPAAADAVGDVQVQGLGHEGSAVKALGALHEGPGPVSLRAGRPKLNSSLAAAHPSAPSPTHAPCQVDLYASEAALLGALGAAVAAADPDIVLGYEVQRASLGYAAERAAELGLPSLLRALSRLPRVRNTHGSLSGWPGARAAWLLAACCLRLLHAELTRIRDPQLVKVACLACPVPAPPADAGGKGGCGGRRRREPRGRVRLADRQRAALLRPHRAQRVAAHADGWVGRGAAGSRAGMSGRVGLAGRAEGAPSPLWCSGFPPLQIRGLISWHLWSCPML